MPSFALSTAGNVSQWPLLPIRPHARVRDVGVRCSRCASGARALESFLCFASARTQTSPDGEGSRPTAEPAWSCSRRTRASARLHDWRPAALPDHQPLGALRPQGLHQWARCSFASRRQANSGRRTTCAAAAWSCRASRRSCRAHTTVWCIRRTKPVTPRRGARISGRTFGVRIAGRQKARGKKTQTRRCPPCEVRQK
jgi:hypothetical protein